MGNFDVMASRREINQGGHAHSIVLDNTHKGTGLTRGHSVHYNSLVRQPCVSGGVWGG